MLSEFLTGTEQRHLDFAFAHIKVARNVRDRAHVPVAAHENNTCFLCQTGEKAVYRIAEHCSVFGAVVVIRTKAFRKLKSNRLRLAAPLCGAVHTPAVHGKSAHYLTEKSRKVFRFSGRNEGPEAVIRVVYAFLRILCIMQNVIGNIVTISAVFMLGSLIAVSLRCQYISTICASVIEVVLSTLSILSQVMGALKSFTHKAVFFIPKVTLRRKVFHASIILHHAYPVKPRHSA